MTDQLQVGPNGPSSGGDGGTLNVQGDRQGALVVSELHGKDYDQAFRNNMFYAYCAAKTVTSANTSATGLIIYNPPNSNVNLAMRKWWIGISVTSATTTGIALAQNAQTTTPSTTTAATASGATKIGGSAGQAIAYSIATLANAPAPFVPLMHNTAAIATTGVDDLFGDLDGAFLILPGYCVSLSALGAASAASAVTATVTWEEVPIN